MLVSGIKSLIIFLYDITKAIGFPNYALAIILMTILLRLALYPLTLKQMKSMKNMQLVQPKIQQLQKKYKNNKEKLNQELMKLYQQYDINPAAGCLPLLIQMPILIGLFTVLRDFTFEPVEHAKFFWVANLSNPDPYYILPILVGIATYVQSKLSLAKATTASNNSMNLMMLYFMPIFIAYISIQFPAGLSLYWVVFNILGVVQQIIINRQPLTEEVERK